MLSHYLLYERGLVVMNIIPPCPQCPYKLGLIQTLKNPCPQCKLEGYKSYDMFKSQTGSIKDMPTKNENKT